MAIVAIKDFVPRAPVRPVTSKPRIRARILDDDASISRGADAVAPIRRRVRAPVEDAPAAAPEPRREESEPGKPRRIKKESKSRPKPAAEPAASKAVEEIPAKPAKKPRKRGAAYKDENGKWHAPEGNVDGFCLPPKEYQFKGKPGPGRPKGSRSQLSIIRKELNQKMSLTIDGVHCKIIKREVVVKLLVKQALEKQDYKALLKLIEFGERLYPEESKSETASSPLGDPALDQMLIGLFLAGLTLGEPDPEAACAGAINDNPDDAADTARDGDDAWNEGDWNNPGAAFDDDYYGEEDDELDDDRDADDA